MVPTGMSCIHTAHAGRKPRRRNHAQPFPRLDLLAPADGDVPVVFEPAPLGPAAQHGRPLHSLRQTEFRSRRRIFGRFGAGPEEVENGAAVHRRGRSARQDMVRQILIAHGIVVGLRFAGIDLGVHAGDPVVVKPAVAPVHADLETVLRRHGLHGLEQRVVFMADEPPFDEEAVDAGRLGRKYLVFEVIRIEIRLHTHPRIGHGRDVVPSGRVHEIGVAADRPASGLRLAGVGVHLPAPQLAVVGTRITHAVVIGIDLLAVLGGDAHRGGQGRHAQ